MAQTAHRDQKTQAAILVRMALNHTMAVSLSSAASQIRPSKTRLARRWPLAQPKCCESADQYKGARSPFLYPLKYFAWRPPYSRPFHMGASCFCGCLEVELASDARPETHPQVRAATDVSAIAGRWLVEVH